MYWYISFIIRVDFEERLRKLQLAVNRVVEKAEEDGIITDEEANILARAKKGVNKYKEMIDKALEDGIIDLDEKIVLNELEEKMYSDTYFTAMEDQKIDDDELLLLRTLLKTVDPKASISWMEEDR